MSQIRVLIIDDEPQIRRFLATTLEVNGYLVAAAEDGRSALEMVTTWRPDLLLLDLGLPELDGLEVIRRLRAWSALPVIVLSARAREADKVAALNMGADDYLTKPFGIAELLARIQVALRHAARAPIAASDAPIVIGDLVLDLGVHRITRRGEEVRLTPTEYAILRTLVLQRGRVVQPRQRTARVWAERALDESSKLRVFINQLRRKIEDEPTRPRYLITEPGVGYRFADTGAALDHG
ncbi:MAG: response regulator [Blastochloris sp.]|nr:response regulator [Blastochloris sp.]